MLARFSTRLADVAQRVVPDPFVIALALTVVAFCMGMLSMDSPDAGALAAGWLERFSAQGTLAFTTQMALILVAGAVLARAPFIAGALGRLADLPRSTATAAALTALVAMSAAFINWGFGLVAGAVLAHQIGVRAQAAGRAIDYPLVGAAGYTGLMVWHGGLSGSAPLKLTQGGPVTAGFPEGGPPILLDQTLFSGLNLAVTIGLLLCVPLVVSRMAQSGNERVPVGLPEHVAPARADEGLLSRFLTWALLGLGALALASKLAVAESWWQALSLDVVILGLVLGGMALFGTPRRYGRAFAAATPEAAGILLQFPFYFGILGLLQASGLVERLALQSADMAQGLASLGLPLQWCFDVVTFVSAGLVNLFVPSGGGQWAVQGTILAEACAELDLPLSRAVMALSYGDEWTNMLQPFWALALLGITGLKARDILGYTMTIMSVSLFIYLGAFALF